MVEGLLCLTFIVCATWILPRRLGLLGLLLAHGLTAVVFFVSGMIAITSGRIVYEDFLVPVGWLLQAFILNGSLMPLGAFAVIRYVRASGAEPRGFPVVPTASTPDPSRDKLPADDRA
jgi:hypothetical protein